MTIIKAIEFFDVVANDYTRADGKITAFQANFYAQEVQKLSVPVGKLLDVGIGTGGLTLPFKEQGYEIYGVDGSQKMLDNCVQRGLKASNLKQADLEKKPIPFENGTFDITITNASLVYIERACQVIAEMIRVTKPEGIIILDPHVHLNSFEEPVGYLTNLDKPLTFAQNDDFIYDLFDKFNATVLNTFSQKPTKRLQHPLYGAVDVENIVHILRTAPA